MKSVHPPIEAAEAGGRELPAQMPAAFALQDALKLLESVAGLDVRAAIDPDTCVRHGAVWSLRSGRTEIATVDLVSRTVAIKVRRDKKVVEAFVLSTNIQCSNCNQSRFVPGHVTRGNHFRCAHCGKQCVVTA